MQSGHLFSAGCPFTICLTQLQHPGRRWQFRHAKLNAGALGGREYIWEGFPPLLFSSSQGVLQNDERRLSLGRGGEGARLLLNAPMCFSSSSSAWGDDGVGPGWPNKSAVFYSCRRCSRSWHDFHSSPVTKGRWWGRYRWCWCRLCCWCRPLFLASHVYIDIVRLKSR